MKANEFGSKKPTAATNNTTSPAPEPAASALKEARKHKTRNKSAHKKAPEHTPAPIYGISPEHQEAVHRVKDYDPDLWNRIRSWN